jgi:hypothetical protein
MVRLNAAAAAAAQRLIADAAVRPHEVKNNKRPAQHKQKSATAHNARNALQEERQGRQQEMEAARPRGKRRGMGCSAGGGSNSALGALPKADAATFRHVSHGKY